MLPGNSVEPHRVLLTSAGIQRDRAEAVRRGTDSRALGYPNTSASENQPDEPERLEPQHIGLLDEHGLRGMERVAVGLHNVAPGDPSDLASDVAAPNLIRPGGDAILGEPLPARKTRPTRPCMRSTGPLGKAGDLQSSSRSGHRLRIGDTVTTKRRVPVKCDHPFPAAGSERQ